MKIIAHNTLINLQWKKTHINETKNKNEPESERRAEWKKMGE